MIIINSKNRKIESILKEYRQKVERLGLIKELRDRTTFTKPSVKRRHEKMLAKYKTRNNGNT